MKNKKKGYGILLACTILFTLMAISTVVPQASASKVCMLGYKAHCTFTPVSTFVCLFLAGSICAIRKRFCTIPS
jgi:hypothetical protein